MAEALGVSLYKPEYCEEVVDFLAQGYSLTAFAGSIRRARMTVWRWTETHPEFAEAVEIGKACAVLWWERAQRKLAETGEGNATACVFGLKNRAAEDWRDVNKIEHSGEVVTRHDLSGYTADELDTLERLIRKGAVSVGDPGGTGPQAPGSVH